MQFDQFLGGLEFENWVFAGFQLKRERVVLGD